MADEDRSSLEENRLTAARLAKVEAMRAAGEEPYPVRFERTHPTAAVRERWGDLAAGTATGERVTVAGRLINTRRVGGLAFGVLRDHTGDIQLFVEAASLVERFDAFDSLDGGDWVGATGEVITTKRGELSVRVESFALLAKGLRPLPDKWHGLQDVEKRHRQRYVDLIVSEEARATTRIFLPMVGAPKMSLSRQPVKGIRTSSISPQSRRRSW